MRAFITYHEVYSQPLVTVAKSRLGQQNTFSPRPHLFVSPSFKKPPPQCDWMPLMLISPGPHWALQSLPTPPPLSSPRHLQFLGAETVGQQMGLPQCFMKASHILVSKMRPLFYSDSVLTQLFLPHPASSQPTAVKPLPHALDMALLSFKLMHLSL